MEIVIHRKEKYIPDDVFEKFNTELAQYSLRNLADLYASRYFFEGVIGFSRGIPLTSISSGGVGITAHLEVKEKDLSKREPRGFGMDIRRIRHMRKLSRFLELPFLYVVRQVNNQAERLQVGITSKSKIFMPTPRILLNRGRFWHEVCSFQ